MGYPVIKQTDFWQAKSANVIFYSSINQLKTFMKGHPLASLVDYIAKKKQLAQKSEPIQKLFVPNKKTISVLYCIYCTSDLNSYRKYKMDQCH